MRWWKIVEKLEKTFIEVVGTLSFKEIFGTDFFQSLLIALIILIFNTLILPLIKKIYYKLQLNKYLKEEDFNKYLEDFKEEIADASIGEIIKKYKEIKRDGKNNWIGK